MRELAGVAAATMPLAPHEVWWAWGADWWAVLGLLSLGGAYARGYEVLRTRYGPRPPVAAWRVRSFAAGWLVLFVALASPLHPLGHTLLTAHMVQHLLLMLAAPPLLIAGRTAMAVSWALPAPSRTKMHRLMRRMGGARWRSGPVAAAIIAAHTAVLWGWHMPSAYNAALSSPWIHMLEHVTMLAAACALWTAVLRRGVAQYGAAVLSLTVTGAAGGALAALLVFSDTAWYAWYDPRAAGWPMSALDDQHLAGAFMWVVGGLSYTAAAAVVFVWWLRALERRRRSRGPRVRGLLAQDAEAERPRRESAPD